MSKLETNTIDTVSGTSTLQVGSTNTSTITLGVSGDTINVPSGVTINNNGTQTGFGGANTPFFIARKTSDQVISDAATTKLTFEATDTESSSGVFDLSNNKFTVATAGKYFFTFNLLAYDTGNHIRRLDIWFKKSGSQKVKFSNNFTNDVGGRDFNVGGSFIFNASANEYFEMFVYQNTGDSGSIELRGASSEQSCYFGGFKLIE